MKTLALSAVVLASLTTNALAERIVSTSPFITQVVEALGVEDQLVGVDTTSRYNEFLKTLPDIGYRISLSTEGILSLKPTLVLWSSESGPALVVEQVNGTGVSSHLLNKPENFQDLQALVDRLGTVLNVEEKSKEVNETLTRSYQKLQEATVQRGDRKAIFIMDQMGGHGSKSFAGADTSANHLIEMIGMTNPFASQFTSYKSVNLETQIQQGADVVLMGQLKEFAEKDSPIVRRDPSALGWPKNVQPKCVFEVDIGHLLVYGVHLYDDALILNSKVDECLGEAQ